MNSTLVQAITTKGVRSKGFLFALAGALFISSDPIFVRLSGVNGFNTAFLFGLFSAISMSVLIQLTDPRGLVGTLKESGWPVVFSGLCMLGSVTTFVLSIKHTSVSNTFFIMSGMPALAAVFSWVFLKEVTHKTTWFAMAAVSGGIAIVVFGSLETGRVFGDVMAVIAVTCVSTNHTILRKYKSVSRLATVGTGGFFLACVMFFLAEPSTYGLNTWLIMAVMGLVTAPMGRVLGQLSSRYISAPEVGVIMLTQVVFAPLWAFGAFGEVPPQPTMVGGAVILISVLTYILSTRKPISGTAAQKVS